MGWCEANGLNPRQASLPLLTRFLLYLFNERNLSVRTIKNYQSALAHHWRSSVGYEVPSEDRALADLYKGMMRERPIPTKHVVEWDIRLVLAYFQSDKFRNWGALSDRDLTLKTIFLLALASGKRRSELHALTPRVQWSHGANKGMELCPSAKFISKTHLSASDGLGVLKPFFIPALDEVAGPDGTERLLCPVRCLKYYLKRTEEFRSAEQQRLFISYRRGMVKDISRPTISSYIKDAILLAYSDTKEKDIKALPLVKAHSVRHVAMSLNALKFYNMDDILRAGAWTTPNVFLSHYVQDFSVDSMSKLSHLNFVVAGSKF